MTRSSTLPAEPDRSCRARLAEVERDCEPIYDDRRGSSGCCAKVMGELRVERLKSYEEAVDTGEVKLLWMFWTL